jgi:hypothetical protein
MLSSGLLTESEAKHLALERRQRGSSLRSVQDDIARLPHTLFELCRKVPVAVQGNDAGLPLRYWIIVGRWRSPTFL